MKYVVFINLGPGSRGWQALPEAQQAEVQAAWGELNQTPGLTPGAGLQPPETATTLRMEHGDTLITDGPYVETKEALDGYFILEAADLDAAIEVAKKVPALQTGGAVEIRPVMEWGGGS
jgi:hypothetical protein